MVSKILHEFCETFQNPAIMPKQLPKGLAATRREGLKQGIINVKEAAELDTDPIYMDGTDSDNKSIGGNNSCVFFDCSFYSGQPLIPVFQVRTMLPVAPDASILNATCSAFQCDVSQSSSSNVDEPVLVNSESKVVPIDIDLANQEVQSSLLFSIIVLK